MLHRLVLLALLALSLRALPARAIDSAAQAREQFQKGQHALDAGRSQEAIDAFEAAYAAGGAPSLLFFLGEAYRQAGDRSKAISEYQLYLEKLPDGPKSSVAEARIAELKKAPAAEKSNKRKVALEDLADLDPDTMQQEIQKDLRAQINHNIATGVLTQNAAGEIRYSWRGMFFIWVQFLRDLVRLS